MSTEKTLLSLVVPCYNESEALPPFMEEVQRVMPAQRTIREKPMPQESAEEAPEDEREEPDVAPDKTFVAFGSDAALQAAGTGTGYAVIWDGTDAASAGFRKGFLDQAKLLGMNVVADLWYEDIATEAPTLAVGLRTLGADTVFVAAGDDTMETLLEQAKAIDYAPNFIQVF